MKLPNRTGSVSKLSGKRRRPWMARVYTPNGYKILGYYRLQSEATTALINAIAHPPAPPGNMLPTLSEVYEPWIRKKERENHSRGPDYYRRCWTLIAPLHSRPLQHLTVTEIEETVEAIDPSAGTRGQIKTMLTQIYDYAIKHDLADRNPAKLIEIRKDPDPELLVTRKIFEPGEVKALFESTDPIDQAVLVGIYSGMRPGELMSLNLAEVDLSGGLFHIAGSKTKSGKFRTIPIHPAILSTVEDCLKNALKNGRTTIFRNRLGHYLTYNYYRPYVNSLGHTPHDTRHTFATVAHSCGMSPLAIKKIMGHSIPDMTEAVYTHPDEGFLIREMSKFYIL